MWYKRRRHERVQKEKGLCEKKRRDGNVIDEYDVQRLIYRKKSLGKGIRSRSNMREGHTI